MPLENVLCSANCPLIPYTRNIYSQQNIRCARDIKHCLLETFPTLVQNTLRGADSMAYC